MLVRRRAHNYSIQADRGKTARQSFVIVQVARCRAYDHTDWKGMHQPGSDVEAGAYNVAELYFPDADLIRLSRICIH